MSERFTRVYSLPENLYAAGSPVLIAAGALLKDNQTGKILAQLKLRNISQKGIKAAKVCIFPCDTIGNPLGDSVSYQYLDLNVARDADFGQKSAITLPNATTRAFAATVEEIIFSDNTVRTASCAAWESLSAPTPLSSLGNPELVKQFCLEYGKNSKNLPLEQKELWYCSCGALNRGEESSCHCCGQSLFALQSIDMDALRANADKRIAAEKAQAEKEAAAAKAKAKKNGKIAAIVVPIAAVLIVGAVLLSNALKKDHAYDDAVALLDAGQYEDALRLYEEAGVIPDAIGAALWDDQPLMHAKFNTAYCLDKLGRREEAVPLWEIVAARAGAPLLKARAMLELGRKEEAKKLLEDRIAGWKREMELKDSGYFRAQPFFISYMEDAGREREAVFSGQIRQAEKILADAGL